MTPVTGTALGTRYQTAPPHARGSSPLPAVWYLAGAAIALTGAAVTYALAVLTPDGQTLDSVDLDAFGARTHEGRLVLVPDVPDVEDGIA